MPPPRPHEPRDTNRHVRRTNDRRGVIHAGGGDVPDVGRRRDDPGADRGGGVRLDRPLPPHGNHPGVPITRRRSAPTDRCGGLVPARLRVRVAGAHTGGG